MIIIDETEKRFGVKFDKISKYSNKTLVVKCDICGDVFEKQSIKIFMARKSSKSEIDVCFNINCIKSKRETTMIKKYGVPNAGLSKELRSKVQSTCLSRYGTLEAMSSSKVRKNINDGLLKKYGVTHSSKLEWVKEKIKKTTFENYGVNHSMESSVVKEKRLQNNLKKYER